MNRAGRWASTLAACCAVLVFGSGRAEAREVCGRSITKENLVACAIAASLELRSEEQSREVLEGRKVAVSPLFPSNPQVSFSAASRSVNGSTPVLNWYGSLGQELEIAGQRGARRRAVDAELEAQDARTLTRKRQVAAAAWDAFFEALAATEELARARNLEIVAARVATVTRAMTDKGLISGIEADLTDASSLAAEQARFESERRDMAARANLASLLGLDPSASPIDVQGELLPLTGVAESARVALGGDNSSRPEIRALEAERRAAEARASALGRARIPNVTASLIAQNDGFNERVFGFGFAIPIPLPQPFGRTYAGEIAEANAVARRTATETALVRRNLRLDLVVALQAFTSREKESAAFTPERVARAEAGIRSIAAELQNARISVRDAVIAQQTLIGLLRAHIEAKRAAAVASVDLARALGTHLEAGEQR
ncbi:MAG: TolC family protein [Polyangiaceae bacterium]